MRRLQSHKQIEVAPIASCEARYGGMVDPDPSMRGWPRGGVDMADLTGYKEKLPEVLDGGSFKNVIQNEGNGEVKRNLPCLIFHHAADRKAAGKNKGVT